MAGSDGLPSADMGPRLGVPGFQDAGAPLPSFQASLPRPEPPRALERPDTLPTPTCILDDVRATKQPDPANTGTGGSHLALGWRLRRTGPGTEGHLCAAAQGQSPCICRWELTLSYLSAQARRVGTWAEPWVGTRGRGLHLTDAVQP